MRTTCCLRVSPWSVSPAPLPVASSASHCKRAAVTALLVVVLPIPISPVARIPYPFSLHSRTSSIPVTMARTVSSSVIVGPFKKFLVPGRTLRSRTPGMDSSLFIPMSTGIVSAPMLCAILQTEDPFLAMDFATASVTSCPDWVTPSSTMPLSAQKISTPFLWISITSVPKMAPICAVMLSKLPMPSNGFARVSQCFFTRLLTASSGAVIRICASSCLV